MVRSGYSFQPAFENESNGWLMIGFQLEDLTLAKIYTGNITRNRKQSFDVIAYLYGGQGTISVPSWSPDSKQIAFVSNSGK